MHLSRGIFPGVIRPISLNPVPALCQLLRWAASPTLPWPLCSVWVGVLCGHRALGFSVASPGPRKAGRPDSNWAGLGERVLPAAKVEQLEYHRAYPSAQARSGGGVRQGQNENCRVGGHGCPVQLSPELDWHCWPLCWPPERKEATLPLRGSRRRVATVGLWLSMRRTGHGHPRPALLCL